MLWPTVTTYLSYQGFGYAGCDITPCSSVCGEGGQTLTQFRLPLRCRTSHPEPAQPGGSGVVTCNQLAYGGAASGRPFSSSACLSEHFLCPTGPTEITLQKATCCHHLWYHICCHTPFPPRQGSQAWFLLSIPMANWVWVCVTGALPAPSYYLYLPHVLSHYWHWVFSYRTDSFSLVFLDFLNIREQWWHTYLLPSF